MDNEARMDAESDYLAEHYQECIEYQDIIDFIESIDARLNHEDLFELRDIINKKIKEEVGGKR